MNNTRWLFGLAKYIKWGISLGLFFVVIKTLSRISFTGIQKFIIDDIFIKERYDLFTPTISLFAFAIICFNIFHFFGDRLLNTNSFRLYRHLTEKVAYRLYDLPTAKYRNERTATFVNYFTNDINSVTSYFSATGVFSEGLQKAVNFIVLSIIVGYASPILLVSVLVLGSLYIPLGKYFGPKMKLASKDVQEKRSDLLIHIEEGISSTREVVAFHRMKWEQTKLDKIFNDYYNKIIREGKVICKRIMYSDPLRWGNSLFFLGFGGYQVIEGHITIGLFVIAYQFSSQLMDSVSGVYQVAMGFSSNLASAERIQKVLDGEQSHRGHHVLTERIKHLTFRDVHFRYIKDGPYVLDGTTIDFPMNQKIAFVGRSGGGKSTISQLLLRFYEPEKGNIVVNGISLSTIDPISWANKVTIVFQEPYLFPDTIRNNLLLNKQEISEEDMIDACRVACIHDYIESLPQGYDTVIGERGVSLSGGQRQRIALARSIVRKPEVLILDEATSALDLHTEREVMRKLDELRKGSTTIIIAHRLSTIANADKIFVIDQGRIVEQGNHVELIGLRSLYKSLYSIGTNA